MFFEKENINLIDKTDEELTDFLKKIDIQLPITDQSSRYCAWAIHEGITKLHLTQVESCSFGYMVSTFYGGMGVSCGTETWFREEEIELKIVDNYNDLVSDESLNDHERKKKLFYFICDLYQKHIDKYAYKTETLSFRTSISTKWRFDDVEGDSFNDKLVNLLRDRKI